MSTGIYRTPWNYHARQVAVKPSDPTPVVTVTGPLFPPLPVVSSAFTKPWKYAPPRQVQVPTVPTPVVTVTGPVSVPRLAEAPKPWDYYSKASLLQYPITIEAPPRAQPLIHPYWVQRQQLSIGRGSLYEPIFDYTAANTRRFVYPITITAPAADPDRQGLAPYIPYRPLQPYTPG